MEGVLGERRWELGAHYTHEVDIMKIVGPTIVRPWTDRIADVAGLDDAVALLDELCSFKVLDPACGCGNFLYIAYRELRALEALLKQRVIDIARSKGLSGPTGLPFVRLTDMQGIEIEPMAALIARVTLWMGHRQMIELYGPAEDPLPLVTLSTIQTGDALRVPWPVTDCIIGNPPFLGASHMRSALGDPYVAWLQKEFKVGIKDLCVYWFRKTAHHLAPGQRAGLVGTNSISQNLGRSASLDYLIDSGGVITDAVSSQKWPGDAKVHVSLVNWVDEPIEPISEAVLDGVQVASIGPDLRVRSNDAWTSVKLHANAGRCFEGPSPKAKGLLISQEEAQALRERSDADYSHVVRPYLTAADITDDPRQRPSRWAIDFRLMPLEQAMQFPAACDIARSRVKPEREKNRRKAYRDNWWLFAEPRRGMRVALEESPRYAVTAGHAKRAVFAWMPSNVLASNATDIFAFDDDFSMGVLQSRAHVAWAWQQSSTLKGDLRYTPSSVFMTFPWPDRATPEQREVVTDACRRLLAHRSALCQEHQVGLTKLYNAMDEGAYTQLKDLHREVDVAVADCYGWPAAVAQDDREIVIRLTELNRQIIEGERSYQPF